jgi:hypothetical protein
MQTQISWNAWKAAWQTSAAAHGVSHGAAELNGPQKANVVFKNDARSCTCHPSERPEPCQRKYALTDCSALQTITDCIKGAEQNGVAEYEDHECYISLAELRVIAAALTPPAEKPAVDVVQFKRYVFDLTDKAISECFGTTETGIYDVDTGNIQAVVGRVFDHLHAQGHLKSKEGE